MEKSIIGMTYIAQDMSYSTCLTMTNGKNIAACGATNYVFTPTSIITEPFEINVLWNNKGRVRKFVLVKDADEHVYSVMFDARGLVSDNKTIEQFTQEADENRKRGEYFDYFLK